MAWIPPWTVAPPPPQPPAPPANLPPPAPPPLLPVNDFFLLPTDPSAKPPVPATAKKCPSNQVRRASALQAKKPSSSRSKETAKPSKRQTRKKKTKKPVKRIKVKEGEVVKSQKCQWKMVKLLGSGRFGDVYKVKNMANKEEHAMKTEMVEGEKRMLRLKIEVTVLEMCDGEKDPERKRHYGRMSVRHFDEDELVARHSVRVSRIF